MAASSYLVERTTTVHATPQQVYDLIADFRNWTRWSPWEGLDPQLLRTYGGAERGVGSTYAWSGNKKAGAGSMRIVDAHAPHDVRVDIEFDKPFSSRSTSDFVITSEDGDVTRVTWTMTGAQTFGLKLMSVFVTMDKLIGGDFERGLAQLKTAAEQQPAG